MPNSTKLHLELPWPITFGTKMDSNPNFSLQRCYFHDKKKPKLVVFWQIWQPAPIHSKFRPSSLWQNARMTYFLDFQKRPNLSPLSSIIFKFLAKRTNFFFFFCSKIISKRFWTDWDPLNFLPLYHLINTKFHEKSRFQNGLAATKLCLHQNKI